MVVNQLHCLPYGVVVHLQTAHHLSRNLRSLRSVSEEMIHPFGICSAAGRFPHVMQQHGKTQETPVLYGPHSRKGMLPYIVPVMWIILRCLHHGVKFRKNHFSDSRFVCHPQILRMFGDDQLGELRTDPLRADFLQIRSKKDHPGQGVPVYGKVQLGGKTNRAQDSQRILGKTLPGRPHTADHPGLQIPYSSVEIDQPLFLIISHGVDREISSLQILLQAGGKGNILRMPAVLVFPVNPVRCHLVAFASDQNGYRPVLNTRVYRVRKQLLDLLRSGGCRNIPVVRNPMQKRIPDTASHRIGLIPRMVQRIQDGFYRSRQTYLHAFVPPVLPAAPAHRHVPVSAG